MLEARRNNLRVTTAESLAELFNQHGIRYAVVNGLYNYPENIGRDLDIIIHPEDVAAALGLCEEVKKELGWEYLFARWSYHGVWQVYFVLPAEDRVDWLEVDLMCNDRNLLLGLSMPFSIGSILNGQLRFRGPFRVSPIGEYLKAYFRPVYYGDIKTHGSLIFSSSFANSQPPHVPVNGPLITIYGKASE